MLDLDLAGHLLDFDDHEFGGLERREPDHDVDDAAVDVALRRRLLVTFDEISFARRFALTSTIPA